MSLQSCTTLVLVFHLQVSVTIALFGSGGRCFQGSNLKLISSISFVKFKCGYRNKTKNQRKLTAGLKSQVADLSAGLLQPSAFYPGITAIPAAKGGLEWKDFFVPQLCLESAEEF